MSEQLVIEVSDGELSRLSIQAQDHGMNLKDYCLFVLTGDVIANRPCGKNLKRIAGRAVA